MNAATIAELVEVCMKDPAVVRDLRKSSVKTYRWHCRSWAAWMGEGAQVSCITKNTRPDYLDFAERAKSEGGRGYSPRLLRCISQALLYFYRWLVQNKHMEALPADKETVSLPPIEKPKRHVAQPDMARAMIAACDEIENAHDRLMLRAIITMFNDVPLRKRELLDLEIQDIDLETGEVQVRQGKGGKDRVNWLSDDGLTALRCYIAERPDGGIPSLWLHGSRRRVGDNWLYRQISALAEIAGIDRKSVLPHACRRGTARRYRDEGGMDLEQIRHMLGHSSLAITQMYIEADDSELKKRRNAARLFAADPPAPEPSAPVQAPPPAPLPIPPVPKRNAAWRDRFVNHDAPIARTRPTRLS